MRRRVAGPKGAGTVAMKAEKRKVRIDNVISVGQLAHEMQLKASVIIRSLMEMGSMVTVNEMLDIDTATLVASEFGYEVENVGFKKETILQHVTDAETDEISCNALPSLPLWDTLTMGRRHCWTRFVRRK